jgi:iron complex outermembrane recepter protein
MDSQYPFFARQSRSTSRGCARAIVTAALLCTAAAPGQAQEPRKDDLTQMNLEQLLSIQVTSVSKKEQKLSNAAAAVFVITQEDIHRSGAQNIPDLLRMVPGVDVAQIDASVWAITIRGFNSRYSNKVLVLVDGRSVYTPTFSGVYWDQLDMPLDDVERIEVIRGPGGTIWGANAVNGVINIITKSARSSRGKLASVSASSSGESHNAVRYGGSAGAHGDYRATLGYSRFAGGQFPIGISGSDSWSRAHAAFRSDFDLSTNDLLTVQGDLFSNTGHHLRHTWYYPAPDDPAVSTRFGNGGGNFLANWSHTGAGGSEMSLQTYYDSYRRDDQGTPEFQRTFDLRLDQHISTAGRHDITWGAGFRTAYSGVARGFGVQLSPDSRTDHLASAFLQDEIQVGSGLWITLGSKIEHNDYTGVEYEPNMRLVWTPNTRETLWAAASRGIRLPNREEFGVRVDLLSYPLGPGMTLSTPLTGNPKQRSEEIRDFEFGYRAQYSRNLSADVSSFVSFYRNLATFDVQTPRFLPNANGTVTVESPVVYGNKARAFTYGAETSINYQVTPFWRLSPGYALLKVVIKPDPTSTDPYATEVGRNAPRNTFNIRSFINLSRRLQWDQMLYWVGSVSKGTVAAYSRLDTRLAWTVGDSAEISVVGQNLLRPGTFQYSDNFDLAGSAARRAVFGKITWRF